MNDYVSLVLKRRFREAEELRIQQIPRTLVKFYSLNEDERLNNKKLNSLRNEEIWLSSIKAFNDPYEFCGLYVDEEKLKRADFTADVIGSYKEFIKDSFKKYAICSLSGNTFDALPMWAYYTNNHKGFCVEYEVINPRYINKVSYEQQRIPIASVLSNIFHYTKQLEKHEKIDEEEMAIFSLAYFALYSIKHISWMHEDEYRLVIPFFMNPNGYCNGFSCRLSAVGLKTSKIVAGLNCGEEYVDKLKTISKKLECDGFSRLRISENKYTLLEEV